MNKHSVIQVNKETNISDGNINSNLTDNSHNLSSNSQNEVKSQTIVMNKIINLSNNEGKNGVENICNAQLVGQQSSSKITIPQVSTGLEFAQKCIKSTQSRPQNYWHNKKWLSEVTSFTQTVGYWK